MIHAARVLSYLQLCRFAAVFTAVSNICAGLALSGRLLPWTVSNTALLIASSGLYLSGMAFNDCFDREIDARERPGRPIPSGRVSAAAAWRFAAGLMALGLAAAAFASWSSQSIVPLAIALPLACAILAYDGFAKATGAGPIVMGLCRGFNILLGASLIAVVMADPAQSTGTAPLAGVAAEMNWQPSLTYAAGMVIYIAGVTMFARNEAHRSRRSALLAAVAVADAGLFVQAGLYWLTTTEPLGRARSLAALFFAAVVIHRAVYRAWRHPEPRQVQLAVRAMLTWIIILDAIAVTHFQPDPRLGIAVAALILPAQWIGRKLAIT